MKLPYGISHFGELRREGYHYLDKTPIIRVLEDDEVGGRFLTLFRPRRFGKTLLVTMLDRYYDLARAHLFDRLFGGLSIGQKPTDNRNAFLTLSFGFDGLRADRGAGGIAGEFGTRVQNGIQEFFLKYWKLLPGLTREWDSEPRFMDPARRLRAFLDLVKQAPHPLYVFVDAYDAFAQDLVTQGDMREFEQLCCGKGFAGEFYREIIRGINEGVIARCLLTGMCPVGFQQLEDGEPVFRDISGDKAFATIAGFEHADVEQLVASVVADKGITLPIEQLLEVVTRDHNGYRFAEGQATGVYHPDMVIYFLAGLEPPDMLPDQVFDLNLHTDATRFKHMLHEPGGGAREPVLEVVRDVLVHGTPARRLLSRVDGEKLLSRETVPTLLYHMGILSRSAQGGEGRLAVPNGAVRQLFWEAFADLVQSSLPRRVSVSHLFRAAQAAAYDGDVGPLFHVIGTELLQQVLWADGMGTLPVPLDQRNITLILRAFLALADVFRPFVALEPDWLEACVGIPVLVLAPGAGYTDARHGVVMYVKFLADGPVTPEAAEEALAEGEEWIENGLSYPMLDAIALEGGWLSYAVVLDGDGGLRYRAPGGDIVTVRP